MKVLKTREETKKALLEFFLENEKILPMKNVVSGTPDNFEEFEVELYDLAHELVRENKLVSVKIYIPGSWQLNELPSEKNVIEWLLPPGSKVLSEEEILIKDIIE